MIVLVWFYLLGTIPIGPFPAYEDCAAARYYQETQRVAELSQCFTAEAKSRNLPFDLDEN